MTLLGTMADRHHPHLQVHMAIVSHDEFMPYLELHSIVSSNVLQPSQHLHSQLEVRHLLQVGIADLVCQGS